MLLYCCVALSSLHALVLISVSIDVCLNPRIICIVLNFIKNYSLILCLNNVINNIESFYKIIYIELVVLYTK